MKLEIDKLLWPNNVEQAVVSVPQMKFDSGVHLLWGISGSGKTSFMECVAGRRQCTQGFIKYGPVDIDLSIRRDKDRWFKQFLSMSFQDSCLLEELTCEENILLPTRLNGLEKPSLSLFAEISEVLQIEDFLLKAPDQISRGQQQRINLARALIYAQEILLLDEPLVYIEKELGCQILEYIIERVRKTQLICLLSSHDPRIAEDARVRSKLDFPLV